MRVRKDKRKVGTAKKESTGSQEDILRGSTRKMPKTVTRSKEHEDLVERKKPVTKQQEVATEALTVLNMPRRRSTRIQARKAAQAKSKE